MKHFIRNLFTGLAALLCSLCSAESYAANPANIPSVPNIATLQALGAAASQYPVVNVVSAISGGVGGGIMYWNPSSTATTSLCGPYAASGVATGRYFRESPVDNVYQCQAAGDGATNDGAAFQAGIDALHALATGGTLYVQGGAGIYNIGTASTGGQLTLYSNVTIQCLGNATLSFLNATATPAIAVAGANPGIKNCVLNFTTAGGPGYAIQQTVANADYFTFTGNILTRAGANSTVGISSNMSHIGWNISNNTFNNLYTTIEMGVGTSTTMTGGYDNFNFNTFNTNVRDMILINTPCGTSCTPAFGHETIIGNKGTITVADSNGGGCLTLAAAQYITYTGNDCVLNETGGNIGFEAYHIEDLSQHITMSDNTVSGVDGTIDGLQLLAPTSVRVPNDIKFTNNRLLSKGAGAGTNTCINNISTTASSYNLSISRNYCYGFATGIRTVGGEKFEGNKIDTASNCINVNAGADNGNIRDTTCANISTSAFGSTSAYPGTIGFVHLTGTLPTAPIAAVSGGNAAIDGLSVTGTASSVASGNTAFYAAGLASFSGRYSVDVRSTSGTAGRCRSSAYVSYGGTMATVTNSASTPRVNGNFSNCSPYMDGSGGLGAAITITTGTNNLNFNFILDGTLYN